MKSMIRPLIIGVVLAVACLIPVIAQDATPTAMPQQVTPSMPQQVTASMPPQMTHTSIAPEAPPTAVLQEALPEVTEAPVPPPSYPEGIMFQAPGNCTVTPDEKSVMSWGNGVFSLPDGLRRFDITYGEHGLRYSPDGRYFAVSSRGLQDAYTGEILIESTDRASYLNGSVFSPDERLFVDGNTVYDLTTFEQVATLNRERNESTDSTQYGSLSFINDGRWMVYEGPRDPNRVFTSMTYVDTTTWQPIIDTSGYPFGMGISFNPDYTRYAVGSLGVFSYPSGEKLFDLPEGNPRFNTDSSVILVTTSSWLPRPDSMTYTFIDGETGEQINRLNVPWDVMDRQHVLYYSMTNAEMSQAVTASGFRIPFANTFVLRGWNVIDMRTNIILQRFDTHELDSANMAIGGTSMTRPIINGRYVVGGEGIFDAETDTLILAQDHFWLSLSPQATYALTQNPCTVWELP